MSTFATRLRQLRRDKDMSQADLAKVLSTSASTIGMYEQGRRTPTFEGLEEMADYFNVDMDYLMGKSDYTTRIVRPDDEPRYASTRHKVLYDKLDKASPDQIEKLEKIWDLMNDEAENNF